MTRREALLALGLMYVLVIAGLTWLFGPYGLIACGAIGAASVLLFFERVDKPRGEDVADAVPREVLAGLERDFSL